MGEIETLEETVGNIERREEYKTHEVYYIEDNKKISWVPGGTELVRVKYIYDRTSKKALVKQLVKQLNDDVQLLTDREVLGNLEEIVQHRIRALNRGTFVRELHISPISSQLLDLIDVMHGYDFIVRLPLPQELRTETDEEYQGRRQKALNHSFDFVVSRG